jgi:ribulose-5-phosphate 4-epimerase/fuculose-1-phosphate aldolase
MSVNEKMIRADLAATFRWAAKLNLHEAVANHFSAAVSPQPTRSAFFTDNGQRVVAARFFNSWI